MSIQKLKQMKQEMLKKKQQRQPNNGSQQLIPLNDFVQPLQTNNQLSANLLINSQLQKQSIEHQDQKQSIKAVNSQKQQKDSKQLQKKMVSDQISKPNYQLQIQKPGVKCLSQNYTTTIRPNNGDNQNMSLQKKKQVKLNRYILKDAEKLKEAIANLDGALKGVQYIRKRIKYDRLFHRKIKDKIYMLRSQFQ